MINIWNIRERGAVLLSTSSELLHKPAKPSDMLMTFYKKALGGTNAEIGVSMSANISKNAPMAESIKGYVDDTSNINPNVGHRLSILDPRADSTSFGYADKHGNVDMFITWNKEYTNDFYAWPSPGNFPTESVEYNAMWSISYDSSKYFTTDDVNIVLKANGKEYSSDNGDFTINYESSYCAYYYKLPDEVMSYLTDGGNVIKEGKKVEVEVQGLADVYGNSYIVKYPVEFFSLENAQETPTYKKGDINGNGVVDLTDYSMILRHVKGIKTLKGEELSRADVNKNGAVDLTDYSMVLRHVKGIKLLE